MFEEQIRDIISGWKTAVKRSQKSPAPRGFSPRYVIMIFVDMKYFSLVCEATNLLLLVQ